MKRKSKFLAAALSLVLICTGCKSTSDTSGGVNTVISVNVSGTSSLPQSSSAVSDSSAGSSAQSSDVSSYVNSISSSSDVSVSENSSSSSVLTTESSSSSESSTSSTSSALSSSSVSTTESSSSSEQEPQPVLPDDPIERRIAQMTLRERVYQMFFVTPEQLGGGYPVTDPMDLSARPVGGILLMGANLESVSQTKNMLVKTQENALGNGIGVFLAVDEEGGKVARCALKLGTTAFSGMAVYGARNDYDEAFYIGKTIGGDLRSLGFNVDFAPVADVDISPTNELGDRIFSDDPNVVANMVSGVVRGLNSAGISSPNEDTF